jgi:hypothetical protein
MVVKQDARGRIRYSKEQREKLLAEFDQSGMSGMSFTRLTGIGYTTFAGWIKNRKKKAAVQLAGLGEEHRKRPIQMVEAMVESSKAGTGHGLHIDLPGGCRINVQTPAQMQVAAEMVALIAERLSRRC